MKIRKKLFFTFLFSGLGLLIFAFLILSYSINTYWEHTTKDHTYNSLYNIKALIEKELNKYRDYSTFIGNIIGNNNLLNLKDEKRIYKELQKFILANRQNIRILEILKENKIIYKDLYSWKDIIYATDDNFASFIWNYMSNPLYTIYFTMSFPYISSNIVVMKNCAFIADYDKNLKLGVSIITTPLDENFLSELSINFQEDIFYIKNSNGIVFSKIDFDKNEIINFLSTNKNNRVFKKINFKNSGIFYHYSDTLFTLTYKENRKTYNIKIADIGILTKNIKLLEQRKLIFRTALLWFFIGVIVLSIFSFIIGNQIAIPIVNLTNKLIEFKNNLKPFNYNKTGNDEISILNKSFSEMTYQIINDRNELEKERIALKQRNEIIENDLSLARKIQLSYLPEKNKFYNIAFIYKSMDKVGGDFFDFIQYKNINSIGIFLSDVSGHGVASALITSMIKNNLIQIAPNINNPSYFLKNLNNSLYKQTAGNFITAFFGILNYENYELLYSNAGHNLPYIITHNDVFLLPSYDSSIPLAILDNNELKELNRDYKNEKIKLEFGTKILFYTDGFTEAIPLKSNDNFIDFERDRLLDSIISNRNLSANEFVNELYNDLVKYRGSEEFDDDVCIICLEII